MDAPLTRGPAMKWQRKGSETDSTVPSSISVNSSQSKTPMKGLVKPSNQAKTPSNRSGSKTPSTGGKSKTPGTLGKSRTPGTKGPKTPGGDRFIPHRGSMQFDLGHFKIMNEGKDNNQEMQSPSQQEYKRVMNENLNGEAMDNKIISYKQKAPSAPEGYYNNMRVLYSTCKSPANTKKTTRHIPQVPERILDAPDILDDYYLNLLDWSASGLLAVCLGGSVYLWNASSGGITQLLQMEGQDDYIGAVSWIKEGHYLAVGTSLGDVQIWDAAQQKRLRTMPSHAARVGSMSWNSYILSSGSRSGNIHHHDVRVANHHVSTLAGHTQEVCGLKWSPDGRYLASGGNDNLLNIWSAESGQNSSDCQPLYSFNQHQAAVKGVAWCPWQPNLLASGGGTADRTIRFWNCSMGTCLNTIDTKSQVCSILWSKDYKELVSSHGFAQNQLIIWKYPTMTKVAELTGHTARVLHMAMSPDGSTVVSAGADETLRLWKCFAVDEQKKKTKSTTKDKSTELQTRAMIR
ncbi:hypothetical protein ScPMuIL_006066 [Solemya velum]